MNILKKWFRSLFRRRVHVMLLLLLQILLILYFVMSGSKYLWINHTLTIMSLLVALHIVSKHDKIAYKLTWVFLILLFPVFGGLFYLLFKFQSSTRRFSKQLDIIDDRTNELYLLPNNNKIKQNSVLEEYSTLLDYLQKFANFPLYDHTESKFLASGEVMYEEMLDELKKA